MVETINTAEDAKRIESIYAYDSGAVDSGIKDDAFKAEVRGWEAQRVFDTLTINFRMFTQDGYGAEDCFSFAKWVESPVGLGIDWI